MNGFVSTMIFAVLLGCSAPRMVWAQGPPPGVDPVNCTGCVGTTDIANGSVTAPKISPGAVGSGQINPTQVQKRVTGACPTGSSITAIDENGAVLCETDDGGVTAITVSAPLVSTGGSTPNLSLPGVIIGTTNTAVGQDALVSNIADGNTANGVTALAGNTTGYQNTASGHQALFSNTEGGNNTATGFQALRSNTVGFFNTASGHSALFNNTGSDNTASGAGALGNNTAACCNTATGYFALANNTTGGGNTGSGHLALLHNATGHFNTAVGYGADVSTGDLSNATAIGFGATVDASDKIRLGNTAVSIIEAQVGLTVVSDATRKETFLPVNGEATLNKIRGLTLTSWNLIGQDPRRFRHYGPMAQEFFAAFGSDTVGTIGTPTTITSTDIDGILMVAVQALERRTAEQAEEAVRLKAENAALKARVEAFEQLMKEALPPR